MNYSTKFLPACAFLFLASAGVFAAGFTPNESLVAAQPDLLDAEYSQSLAKVAWADHDGHLWLADVDRQTGMYVPADGKGTLVDPSAVSGMGDRELIGNGPEWVSTSTGEQIVYTKFPANQPHSRLNAYLAIAWQAPNGNWTYRYLSPQQLRNAPYASSDPGDPWPRVSYVDPYGNHFWRDLYDDSSEALVPWYPPSYRSMRFVRGERALIFTAPDGRGVRQVVRYWLDTQQVEQLTFDKSQNNENSVPWMWQAPEYNNDLVFLTISNSTELRVYRQSPVTGRWTIIRRVSEPNGGTLNSPEPFVYKGKSYIFMAASDGNTGYPSAIYLSNIDDSHPLLRKLTVDKPQKVRLDPEIFITKKGPYIYYNRFDPKVNPADPNCDACSEGVYRAYTGLPPP